MASNAMMVMWSVLRRAMRAGVVRVFVFVMMMMVMMVIAALLAASAAVGRRRRSASSATYFLYSELRILQI